MLLFNLMLRSIWVGYKDRKSRPIITEREFSLSLQNTTHTYKHRLHRQTLGQRKGERDFINSKIILFSEYTNPELRFLKFMHCCMYE